jgi:4-alpha-glucanotransferase
MRTVTPFPERELGVLLHPTSLFGRDLVGTLGDEAYGFVDWLAGTGARLWQILPLTMNGTYDSPYSSRSAFAGNPWLIDLPALQRQGLLEQPDLLLEVSDAAVPFDLLPARKLPQLRAAARALRGTPEHPWHEGLRRFRTEQQWLADTCLFFALKDAHGDAPWFTWPAPLRRRDPQALREAAADLAAEVADWETIFFLADAQWLALLGHTHARGLRVLGDLPIYVSHDSADVWRQQDQFQLDPDGHLLVQSGVPPDYFSETGQLWGNPLYRWDVMAADGFSWWLQRLRRCLELTDLVRIDHFRALSAYWEVPGDASDARSGRWVPGPGQAFFDALRREFPTMPFVAEDLGTLDDEVLALRDENDLPGMAILQFGFDGTPDNPHQPHRFTPRCLVYTGTHDNEPVAGWWASLDDAQRAEVAGYFQVPADADAGRLTWALIESAIGSRAQVAVIPVQDLLVLDSRSRMNDPSVFVGNWSWRMPPDGLSPALAASLRALAERYARVH